MTNKLTINGITLTDEEKEIFDKLYDIFNSNHAFKYGIPKHINIIYHKGKYLVAKETHIRCPQGTEIKDKGVMLYNDYTPIYELLIELDKETFPAYDPDIIYTQMKEAGLTYHDLLSLLISNIIMTNRDAIQSLKD